MRVYAAKSDSKWHFETFFGFFLPKYTINTGPKCEQVGKERIFKRGKPVAAALSAAFLVVACVVSYKIHIKFQLSRVFKPQLDPSRNRKKWPLN